MLTIGTVVLLWRENLTEGVNLDNHMMDHQCYKLQVPEKSSLVVICSVHV